MDGRLAIETIKGKLAEKGGQVRIPMQKGGSFNATLADEGILVDNLGSQPLLEWIVFEEVVELLVRKGGRAKRGDAMGSRLGDEGLPLDSIEGHIAHMIYGRKLGESVFRRISPVSAILVWAGIFDAGPGELIMREISV